MYVERVKAHEQSQEPQRPHARRVEGQECNKFDKAQSSCRACVESVMVREGLFDLLASLAMAKEVNKRRSKRQLMCLKV